MNEQELRKLPEELQVSPEASVPILNSMKYGVPCLCRKDIAEANKYIQELEAGSLEGVARLRVQPGWG